ncbi:hypothetical protein PSH28_22555 [Pseudomonas resinovorans]|uniref:hypothetical protein n=1 Tax=Metapseudomonas resinovorans TaxID=53412 RepID=UPI00237FB0FA|nr:hypothetical protein [Pseudomonas resinovorans]MDE3739395.1 hypothetical protein [Pseudomonas resinovorans]
MTSKESHLEAATAPTAIGASAVFRQLHDQCSQSLEQSLQGENATRLAESYLFASDLDAWRSALDDQLEVDLIKTAASEYVLATLNVCQGQYRNGFKGLRLVLELCLQSTHLSANLVLRAEWLKGETDTIWATLVDGDNGPLSSRSCRAFFPELLDHVGNFRQLAKTLYRELSECIHGNVPNHIPLPDSLIFSQETFDLWQSKAKLVRLVVLFALVLRYLNGLPTAKRSHLEAAVQEQLGHIAAIRDAFEQGN